MKKGSMATRVYNELRRSILELTLPPGSNLDENDFLEMFNVSRTPIREAFLLLSNDGLVILSPNKGAHVSSVEFSRACEFFDALEISQRIATRWAAIRRKNEHLERIIHTSHQFEEAAKHDDTTRMIETNIEFHKAIAEGCGNSFIQEQYSYLLTFGHRLSRISLTDRGRGDPHYSKKHLQSIIREHQAIVKSLKEGDAEKADRLARDHVGLFRNAVMSSFNRSSVGDFVID